MSTPTPANFPHPAATPPAPPSRRRPQWVKVVLVLVGLVMIAVLAVAALLTWALSGGWDGLRPTASPDDRAVARSRERAGPELDALTERTLTSTGQGRVLARLRTDTCTQGQNNWKVRDGYTLRCELSDAVVLAAPDASVTAAGARLQAAATTAGWVVQGTSELTQPAQPDRSFLEQARAATFTRDDSRLRLQLGVTVRGTTPLPGDIPYDQGAEVSGDTAAYRQALGPPGELRVVVRTTVRYFED